MRIVLLGFCALALAMPAQAALPSTQLDELTSAEVREALRAGVTTVIIPVGGTEQNGPHMALGKHNFRAAALAGRIAAALGNALAAPVVAYVPEGDVSPPSGHMRFAGTISVPAQAFAAVVGGAARSLRQHGFRDIVLVGDSGNYQGGLERLAGRLNREWAASPARVHYIGAYYRAANEEFAQLLRSRGLSDAQIGTHAGAGDTSLMLGVDARHVRADRLPHAVADAGVRGDAARADAELGRQGAELVVRRTAEAIRQAIAARPR